MGYLSWNEQTITNFSDANINAIYNQGYVFTRRGNGVMNQTRSVRIDLSKFELSSENRRIVKKTDKLQATSYKLPYINYHWSIGKLAKDFYDKKFGKGIFSANKVKELMTDPKKSNFNRVFVYSLPYEWRVGEGSVVGYCICLETDELIHYSYPFYQLQATSYKLPDSLGLGMMLRAILYAKKHGKKYIYLGSAQRPSDTYKLQFVGLEWFDGKKWRTDINELKTILNS